MNSYRFLLVLCLVWPGLSLAADDFSVSVNDNDISVSRTPAAGSQLIIWATPAFSSQYRIQQTIQQLARKGYEVWFVNLSESLFMPAGPSSQRKISGDYIAALIETAHRKTGKRITVVGRSYSAIPVLRGVREWQLKQTPGADNYLNGVVLFSPELYATIPSLGLAAEYMPITSATNVPMVIFQAEKRGNRWQLNSLLEKLQSGGAQVYVKLLKGVTGLYYDGDMSPATSQMLERIPGDFEWAIKLLQRTPTSLQSQPLPQTKLADGRGLDMGLTPFKGNPMPPPINLHDTTNQLYTRSNYTDKVTVINFWATWCGPCVKEIPALNKLRQKMANQPFELISVNYAEDPAEVKDFLNKVKVDFPVLLDNDGKVAAQWQVLVFPSTFIIGPQGKIVYGVSGAIHWDSADVVSQLKQLLNTPLAE